MKKLSMALAVIICAMLLLTGCDVAGATGGIINFENIANNIEGIGELLEGLGDISSLIEGIGNNQSSEYPTTGENDWETAYGTEESFVPDEQTATERPDRPQRPESPTESSIPDVNDPNAPELNGSDYGGRSVMMLAANEDNGWMSFNDGGSVVDSAVYARGVAIGEQLNVVLEIQYQYDSTVTAEALRNHALNLWCAGMPVDIVIAPTVAIQSLALQGAMGDWYNSGVEVDREWWYQDAKDQFTTTYGRLYSLAGDGSHAIMENTLVTYVNLNSLSMLDLGSEQLYSNVDRNAWTYEMLYQYSQKMDADLDGDGAFTLRDRFGYGIDATAAYAVIASNGEHMLVNSTGKWSFNSGITERLINVTDYVSGRFIAYASSSDFQNAFEEGRSLFYTQRLSYAEDLKNYGVNFGILPTPNYYGSDYVSLVTVGAPVIGYCRGISELALVADVVDLLGYYGTGTVSTYAYSIALDSRTYDMLGIVHSSLFFDYDHLMRGSLYSAVAKQIINGNYAIASTVASYRAKAESEVRNWSETLDGMAP